MFRGFLRPGEGFREFQVLKSDGDLTKTGRPQTGKLTPSGTVCGILSQAKQHEREQWKQNGHPITHTVVQRWAQNAAKPTDTLQLVTQHGTARRFLVQGIIDPGELGHFTIYYVEERVDLQ